MTAIVAMNAWSSSNDSFVGATANGPLPRNVPATAIPANSKRVAAASRGPKRRAAHTSTGTTTNAIGRCSTAAGSIPPKTTPVTATTVAARRPASAGRCLSGEGVGGLMHNTSSGAITRAPATSPSHHVSQIGPYADHAANPASASVVTPMVALIAVLTSPARTANRNTSAGRLKLSTPLAKRLTSDAATTASSVLPVAIPSDVSTVPAVVTLTTNAPANSAGQMREPSIIVAATPIPVGG